MALFEPADSVAAIERSLRQLLDFTFRRDPRLGSDWYDTSQIVNAAMRRQAQLAAQGHRRVAEA